MAERRIRDRDFFNARRIVFVLILCAISLTKMVGASRSIAAAQLPEPTPVIDAVFRDLTARLGQPMTRQNVQNFTWQQVTFPDGALGCPAPGVSYIQATVSGYQVIVTTRGTNQIYDYRTNLDGTQLVLCQNGQPAAAVPTGIPGTPATATLPPTATPLPPLSITSSPADTTTIAPAGTVTAYPVPIAFIGSDGNVYVTNGAQNTAAAGDVLTPITGDAAGDSTPGYPFYTPLHLYENPAWSPDSTKLIFDDGLGQTIDLVESGKAPRAIVQGFNGQLPPRWAPDGQSILYTTQTNSATTLFSLKLDGSPATTLGSLPFAVGCSGGTTSLLDQIYTTETGLNGNLLLFARTPNGIVYSTGCSGTGLALAGTDGVPIWAHPDLIRPVLSPDGTQIAALQVAPSTGKITALVKVDVPTGNVIPLVQMPDLDQTGWLGDSHTIVFSTRSLFKQLVIPASAPLGAQLFAPWPPAPNDSTSNALKLYTIPDTGGQPANILLSYGYAISTMAPTGDPHTLIISQISDLSAVFDGLANNQPIGTVQAAFPFPKLSRLTIDSSGNTVQPIAHGGRPAGIVGIHNPFSALAIAVPAAITPGVAIGSAINPAPIGTAVPPQPIATLTPAATVAPPALVIGGKAVVTATGAVLNVRDSPSASGHIVRQLENGDLVTIVGGPVTAGGFRWWQIQLSSGVVGWAIDQFTDNTGTTNTLSPQ